MTEENYYCYRCDPVSARLFEEFYKIYDIYTTDIKRSTLSSVEIRGVKCVRAIRWQALLFIKTKASGNEKPIQ